MATLVERWSLRLRMFLFFALIGLGAIVAIAVALVLARERIGAAAGPPLVLFGGAAAFAIVGLCLWVWMKFDEHVARPIERLAGDLRAIAHGGASGEVDEKASVYLGFLAPAARDIARALRQARSDVDQTVREATREVEQQKGRLEVVLRDLQEAVLICTLDHKILLYNRRALEILHISGDIGLGRSLFDVVTPQPFRHALDRLRVRFTEGRHVDHEEGLSTLVVCKTADGAHTLRGRVSLLLDAEGLLPDGYVATFSDATRELAEHAQRDRLLQEATGEMRRPAASLLAAAEMLEDNALDQEGRAAFERILVDEAQALSARLQRLEEQSRDLLAGAWPMSDVYSPTLFHCVLGKRRSDAADVEIVGDPVWMHGDSLTIVELVDHLIDRLKVRGQAANFTLQAVPGSQRAYLELAWKGDVIASAELDDWLANPLDDDLGDITGRDVLDRHRAELWCEALGEDGARLRMPLPFGKEVPGGRARPHQPLPERPEFYDFDLLGRMDPSAIDDTPLKALTYVVFDTETTGLEPSAGDEMISIAGIRVVNGRVLRGEVFDHLINPGRGIPPASTEVHGISEAMVRTAPPLSEVLPRFRRFVGEAVMVAHNAAFDMKFLTLKQERFGLHFDNPVLDTVLLAAHVHGVSESLTLDSLAVRYGVRLADEDRHTALGDSIATAEVFLRLIDLLEAAGIRTLRDAVLASGQIVAIRRKQAKY
ncbi:MAG: exonuclease domain-containing protein [Alphaproteobacteria bacterium]